MQQRVELPDVLKGLAILFMIQVHLMELIARPEIYNSLIGKISLFLGGAPAAPVFMMLMGYFFARSGKPVRQHIFRGIRLIGLGLLLNIGLNTHLLIKLVSGSLEASPWTFIFGVDILFLAGLSLILMACFKLLAGNKLPYWIALMFLVAFLNPYLPVYTGEHHFIKYLQAFFWGYFSWSYFPLFPWMAYPLLGVVCFLCSEKFSFSTIKTSYWLALSAIITTALILTFHKQFIIASNINIFYHHPFTSFIWNMGFMIVWAFLIHLATKGLHDNIVLKYIRWTGRNVTAIYVFQWLFIGNIATSLYRTQGFPWLIAWFLGIMTATSLLTAFYISLKKHQDI